ncbi:MAG: DUF177 domain-containing protein [Melioribacteraceae bacterium]
MIIKISTLSNGNHEILLEKKVKELKLDQPFVDDLILNCKVDKSDYQIVIDCKLHAVANFICDRCTADFNLTLHSDFKLVYFFDKGNIDKDNTSIRYLPDSETEIDLTKDAFEFAQFSIPMKKLCDEDCNGLCSNCGINLNEKKCDCKNEETNPVWDKLLELKDKLN